MSNETPDVLVRYVRNAETNVATEELHFPNDTRPALPIGGVGYVSQQEISLAGSHGVILQPIDEKEALELGYEFPQRDAEDSDEKPLTEMSSKELDDVAEAEGVDLTGKRSNADKAAAIQERRSNFAEGRDSLPATAARGQGQPVVPSETAGSGTTTSPSSAGTTGGPAT